MTDNQFQIGDEVVAGAYGKGIVIAAEEIGRLKPQTKYEVDFGPEPPFEFDFTTGRRPTLWFTENELSCPFEAVEFPDLTPKQVEDLARAELWRKGQLESIDG